MPGHVGGIMSFGSTWRILKDKEHLLVIPPFQSMARLMDTPCMCLDSVMEAPVSSQMWSAVVQIEF